MNGELNESVVTALVEVLEAGLPAAIDTINTAATNGIMLDKPAAVLDYMPIASDYGKGLPLVAIQDLPGSFENDLTHSMEATYGLGVASIIETSDHRTLAWQLRRYTRAVFNVIQADRLLGPAGSKMAKAPALVQYVRFMGTEPGPLLGDRNPDSPGEPPSSFRSWTWLLIECRRQEVGG
jgi:hypothetical protein